MFAGLSEVLAFLNTYKFTEEQIAFLRLQLVHAEDEFFDYLRGLDCSKVRVLSFKEGRSYLSLSFPARIRKHCAIARASKVQTTFFGPLDPAASKQSPPPPPPTQTHTFRANARPKSAQHVVDLFLRARICELPRSIVFPREPLLRVEGPIGVCQVPLLDVLLFYCCCCCC